VENFGVIRSLLMLGGGKEISTGSKRPVLAFNGTPRFQAETLNPQRAVAHLKSFRKNFFPFVTDCRHASQNEVGM